MLEGRIENLTKSDSNLAPIFVDHRVLPDINFNGRFLVTNKVIIQK